MDRLQWRQDERNRWNESLWLNRGRHGVFALLWWWNVFLEHAILLVRDRRFTVLLDVESSQQHDGLFAENAPYGWVWWVDAGVGVNGQDTSSAAEAIIGASVVAGGHGQLDLIS